ncbi:MAG TPA: ankyrin repeat domain-containing protein [Spirochaetota bacterium]|nr:ankyrin repeat domain-containing protein [Spirochaetota bacterium]HNT12460.1 ankyrin repeat domain-containing protein [Spirochaetota bacterium]
MNKNGMRMIYVILVAVLGLLVLSSCASKRSNMLIDPANGDNPQKMLQIAFRSYQDGYYGTAREIASYCIRNNMRVADSCNLLGKCYFAEGDRKQAAVAFKMAIKNNPRLGDAYTGLAIIAAENGEIEESLYHLKAGEPYCQNNAMFHHLSGTLQSSMGNYKNAAGSFLMAISLNPYFRPAYSGLIHCFAKSNQEKEADTVRKLWEKNSAQFAKEMSRKRRDPSWNKQLVEAVIGLDVKTVRDTLHYGADPNQKFNSSPLIVYAAGMGYEDKKGNHWHQRNYDIAKLLLEYGADPNSRCNRGGYALEYAATPSGDSSNLKLVQLLLDHGANINARDKWGRTILTSLNTSDEDIVKLLIKNGARK